MISDSLFYVYLLANSAVVFEVYQNSFLNLLFKLYQSIVTLPHVLIFTNILSTGVYPDAWKKANLIPIHKKGSKQISSNYRPISLLPICSKIFEKIIFKNVYNHLLANNLLTKNQSGFRPGDSAINQLIDLVNDIHMAFDQRKSLEVRAIFSIS